jgi:DNA (cytosine-5)-methyltransferase 1
MNHKEKLLEVYEKSFDISDVKIGEIQKAYLDNIVKNISSNKGAYTVLVTLFVHKLLFSDQDIRLHQSKMKKGFSARSIDTKFITPTLKELGLPSMAESGWLTRSLEQPYPYTSDYEGEISGKGMKESFLKTIDFIEVVDCGSAEDFLRFILNGAIQEKERNKVPIQHLAESDDLAISKIIDLLEEHFTTKYGTSGGAKLPVLAFYAMYKILVGELGRYKGCELALLGSHTACDKTSNTAGDLQIMKSGQVFEAIEVKLDKLIDANMLRVAREKILKFNPIRYYVLSYIGTNEEERNDIEDIIFEIKNDHGCQVIVNGLLHTLRYYLRLISSAQDFFNNYIELVEKDTELKAVHKERLVELIEKYYSKRE